MNITVIVALIAAIAAIVSPLVTAYIQRKSLLEIKQLEIIYKDKADAYKSFPCSFGNLNENKFVDQFNQFLSSAYRTMLFVKSDCRIEIQTLIEMVHTNDYFTDPEMQSQFSKCMDMLNADLEISHAYCK